MRSDRTPPGLHPSTRQDPCCHMSTYRRSTHYVQNQLVISASTRQVYTLNGRKRYEGFPDCFCWVFLSLLTLAVTVVLASGFWGTDNTVGKTLFAWLDLEDWKYCVFWNSHNIEKTSFVRLSHLAKHWHFPVSEGELDGCWICFSVPTSVCSKKAKCSRKTWTKLCAHPTVSFFSCGGVLFGLQFRSYEVNMESLMHFWDLIPKLNF